jgi:hypothetical protein
MLALPEETSVLTVDDMARLASSAGGVARAEVPAMCRLFSKLGFACYFDGHAQLKDYVVIKPQRVIDAISTVITLE